jgi:uncharacterized protein (DUF1501 family)
MKRRAFLKNATFASVPFLIPVSLNSLDELMAPARKRNLVLIHLSGGNDGYNTLIPYTDPAYYSARPTLAIEKDQVIPLNHIFGFHPSLKNLKQYFDDGKMLVINNVGSPLLDASHCTSCELWESVLKTGSPELCLSELDFQNGLKKIAGHIKSSSSEQIFRISLDGFDTHQFQKQKHAYLLKYYADGLNNFIADLQAAGQLDNTMIITWSEFGRQLKENTKKGTGHGNVNMVFIHGGKLKKSGIWEEQGLKTPIDPRCINATALTNWLKVSPARLSVENINIMNWI